MATISRKRIRLDTEKTIIIALITSTDFCSNVVSRLNIDYFKTKPVRIIAKWVVEYYHTFGSAPGEDIEEIYKETAQSLESDDAELVGNILAHLSEKHDEYKQVNIPYLTKKTNRYFNKRALELTCEKLSYGLEKGNIKAAEQALIDHKKIAEDILSPAVNPTDETVINSMLRDVYNVSDESTNTLFSFSGRLGQFMGPLKRGWLIGFMGPMKRGKSYWLIFLMFEAILHHKKVIFFSLEMSAEEILERFYQLTTGGFLLEDAKYLQPIFDCFKNQRDKCNKSKRTGDGELEKDEDNSLEEIFNNNRDWVTCTKCRGTKDFKVGIWFEKTRKRKTTLKESKKHIDAFNEMYSSFFRIVSYPAYSANIGQVVSDIDKLEYTEGFIPDVLVIDYADILAPEDDAFLSERGVVDITWKTLRRLSGVRNCLVATASQSNRGSILKRIVEQVDTAEDIRKIAHVVAMYGLNQTEDEKDMGYMRLNIVAHRFKKFIQEQCVYVTQNMNHGQTAIDSEF